MINTASYFLAATGSKTKTTSTGGSSVFLILIVVIALMYFFVMRPNQKRRMAAMRQARTFDIGDEVVAGGMVGRVVRMDESTVDIEISDGVIVRFVPQAVQLRSAYLAAQARSYGGRNARAKAQASQDQGSQPPAAASSDGPVLDVAAPVTGSPFADGYGAGAGQVGSGTAANGSDGTNASGVTPASGEL